MPTAFASVLLWYLLTNVTTTLDSLQDTQLQLVAADVKIVENQGRIIDLLLEHSENDSMTSMLLQAMCINAAESQSARDRCTEALRFSR